MAKFLSQDEIDALLDAVDDDTNEKNRKLDESTIPTINVTKFPGTQPHNLQTIGVGRYGYLEYAEKYSGKKLIKFKVVQVSDSGNIAVLTDELLDSIKVKVVDIEDRFYKDNTIYELNCMKHIYLKMVETFDYRYNLSPQQFLDRIEEIKKDYPEIWV